MHVGNYVSFFATRMRRFQHTTGDSKPRCPNIHRHPNPSSSKLSYFRSFPEVTRKLSTNGKTHSRKRPAGRYREVRGDDGKDLS